MQNEVIDDILKVESEATRIINDAEKEAQDIILEAQSIARKSVAERIEQVRADGNKEIELANKVLQEHIAEYEAQREKIEKEGSKLDSNVLSQMVIRVVERISGVN